MRAPRLGGRWKSRSSSAEKELAALALGRPIIDLAPELNDFADMAAVAAELDLVIMTPPGRGTQRILMAIWWFCLELGDDQNSKPSPISRIRNLVAGWGPRQGVANHAEARLLDPARLDWVSPATKRNTMARLLLHAPHQD
jgi:hypothetical protein